MFKSHQIKSHLTQFSQSFSNRTERQSALQRTEQMINTHDTTQQQQTTEEYTVKGKQTSGTSNPRVHLK